MSDSSDQMVQDSIEIDAPAAEIFAVVANPHQHQYFDGSETVKGTLDAPTQVKLGDTFGMRMRLGVPYSITSTIVEYDQDRKLGWSHLGRHVWRYEFEPLGENRTRVTETFDYGPAIWPKGLEILNYPARHRKNIAATLKRLKEYVESGDAARDAKQMAD